MLMDTEKEYNYVEISKLVVGGLLVFTFALSAFTLGAMAIQNQNTPEFWYERIEEVK